MYFDGSRIQVLLGPGVIFFTSCMQSEMADPLNYYGHQFFIYGWT